LTAMTEEEEAGAEAGGVEGIEASTIEDPEEVEVATEEEEEEEAVSEEETILEVGKTSPTATTVLEIGRTQDLEPETLETEMDSIASDLSKTRTNCPDRNPLTT
jgi:hypothetical protein